MAITVPIVLLTEWPSPVAVVDHISQSRRQQVMSKCIGIGNALNYTSDVSFIKTSALSRSLKINRDGI